MITIPTEFIFLTIILLIALGIALSWFAIKCEDYNIPRRLWVYQIIILEILSVVFGIWLAVGYCYLLPMVLKCVGSEKMPIEISLLSESVLLHNFCIVIFFMGSIYCILVGISLCKENSILTKSPLDSALIAGLLVIIMTIIFELNLVVFV